MGDVVKSTPSPVAIVVALTSNTEEPAIDVLIMNVNGPNGGPETAERRKRVIKQTILDTKSNVVLFQEFKWKDVSGKTWNDSALPEYYEYFRNEEASILIDIREVVATEINQRNLRVILERLQSNPSSRLKVAFPTDFNPLPRMTVKKFQSKQNLEDVILVVSWHGRWNKTSTEVRKQEFKYLMEFLRQVKNGFNDLPLIVAGDFNIDVQDILSLLADPFEVTCYTASERRAKNGVKDYFIASKELCLTDMQCIDLDGVKGLSQNDKPFEILDHDPVKCKVLSSRQRLELDPSVGEEELAEAFRPAPKTVSPLPPSPAKVESSSLPSPRRQTSPSFTPDHLDADKYYQPSDPEETIPLKLPKAIKDKVLEQLKQNFENVIV